MSNGPQNDGGAVPQGIGAAGMGSPLSEFRLGDFALAGEPEVIDRLSTTVNQHFSSLQSSYDQRIAALEQQLSQDSVARKQAELQASLKGRPASQQAQILARHRQQQLDEREQRIAAYEQQIQQAQQRLNDIATLSERWGAPQQLLEQAQNYQQAEAVAVEYFKRRLNGGAIPPGQMVASNGNGQPSGSSIPRYDDPELDLVTAYMKRGIPPQQAVNMARQQIYGQRR